MLNGTMVPIPKGRWANLTTSDNFRATPLSSIFGIIVMNKENENLCTSGLQFSFKHCYDTRNSVIFCTLGSNVYGLLLDASKAFDRMSYFNPFNVLLDR